MAREEEEASKSSRQRHALADLAEDDEEMAEIVRNAVLGQSTGTGKRSAGKASVKELDVEQFSGSASLSDGSSYAAGRRNIPIEEYLQERTALRGPQRQAPRRGADAVGEYNVADYVRAGAKDLNGTRYAATDDQGFRYSVYKDMDTEAKMEYIARQAAKMKSWVGRVQHKESYLLRLFLASEDAKFPRRPLSARIREKRKRRQVLRQAGIDPAADEAISNWSDQGDHHMTPLVSPHDARACRLPDLGAVSVNPAHVPATIEERRASLAERSLAPLGEGVGASVSGLLKINKKGTQTSK